MKRDEIVIEVQRRLNLIKTANGHPFDINAVYRNPEEEPNPELMPTASIFEFADRTLSEEKRSSRNMPIYKKEFSLAIEFWYKSDDEGRTSRDIMIFLKAIRQVIFSDGITLGRTVSKVFESEVSRVYRPGVASFVVGMGAVLTFIYIEDFSTM